MAAKAIAVAVAAAVVGLASAAFGASAGTNGLISFGLCCGSDVGIYVIRPDGTGQKRIYRPSADDANLATAWSPSGARIAFVAPGGLWTMSATGRSRFRITAGKGGTGGPTWSPDGNRIAYFDLYRRGSRKQALYVAGGAGGSPKRIASGKPFLGAPAWSPSGKVILFDRGGFLWTVRPTGKGAKKIAPGSSGSWSPNGKQIAFDRKGDLWTMNANGTGAKLVVSVRSGTAGIAWSPDAKWIAYGLVDRGDIRLVHPDGSGDKPLTRQPGLSHSLPAWQPKP